MPTIKETKLSKSDRTISSTASLDRLILREESDEDSDGEVDEEVKKQRAKENDRYFMGYFKWHWGRNGFWSTLWAFYGFKLRQDLWWTFFNSVGLAFGSFLARTFFFRDEWMSVWYIKYR